MESTGVALGEPVCLVEAVDSCHSLGYIILFYSLQHRHRLPACDYDMVFIDRIILLMFFSISGIVGSQETGAICSKLRNLTTGEVIRNRMYKFAIHIHQRILFARGLDDYLSPIHIISCVFI